MTTDPIADLLTRLRNAIMADHEQVHLPYSRVKHGIVQVLHQSGYIESFEVLNPDSWQARLVLKLRYHPKLKSNAITHLRRISKPGLRIYCKADELPHVLGGLGIAIVSTSKGIMTDKQARKARLGGEVLCHIY